MVQALYGFGRTGGGAGLTGVGRGWVRKIWHGRVKAPICEDAHTDGESYEKRKPCRGVIPNGLGIAAFCPLRSVQLLGCHCEFPLPERNARDCGVVPRWAMGWCGLANHCHRAVRQLMSNIAKKQAKKSPHWKRA